MPENFSDYLNECFGPLFKCVSDNSYIPTEYRSLTEGMTGYNSGGHDAFVLNPPVAGSHYDLRREPGLDISLQPAGDRFILRGIIGYAMAATCGQSPNLFCLRLSNIINGMVGAAYKVYGPRIERLTFENPGYPGEYFRELENNDGYDLRLYGELTPVVVPLEMETVNE